MRRLGLLVLVVAVVLAAAAPAGAHRTASRTEAAAIGRVVRAYIHGKRSPVARDSRIRTVTVSTVDRGYALVKLTSRTAGPGKLLLHARKHVWRVLGFAQGGFSCSLVPGKIFRDLLGSAHACLAGGY